MIDPIGNVTELCRTEAAFCSFARVVKLWTQLTLGSGSWVSVRADEDETRREAEQVRLRAVDQLNRIVYGKFSDQLLQIALELQGVQGRLPWPHRELSVGQDLSSVHRKILALHEQMDKQQAPPIIGLDKAISDAMKAKMPESTEPAQLSGGGEGEPLIVDTRGCE